MGSVFTVPANAKDAKTLTPDTSGWIPFVTVRVWCNVAPSSGTLDIWFIKSAREQTKIVNSLAIRDTEIHTFSSDAGIILIEEW